MTRIAYYVTGHGLGHASRSVLVVKYLLKLGHNVEVITSVRASFFLDQTDPCYKTNLKLHNRTLDGGAIQSTPLSVDGIGTLERYYSAVHSIHEELLSSEIGFLKNSNIEVVVSDATSIACRAAKEAGCKVAILSNFTWDWIYLKILEEVRGEMTPEDIRKYTVMIDQCASDYCCSDMYLQLPGACPLPDGFDGELKLREGPLLAGHASRGRGEMRRSLGLDDGDHVLLLGFGGHKAEWRLADEFLPVGWKCLVLGADESDMPSGGRFQSISFNCHVPDLVHAADCVLGKLGFGFVSECLSNGTPLLYISRSCWPEEAYLRSFMSSYRSCREMPVGDFSAGKWELHLEQALATKQRMMESLQSENRTLATCPKDTDATQKICNMIFSLLYPN